jgi:hypothetical protein
MLRNIYYDKKKSVIHHWLYNDEGEPVYNKVYFKPYIYIKAVDKKRVEAVGIDGEELAILDIDHKAVLIFNAKGGYVGKSTLPKDIKLRAQNHYNGLGYTNNLFFIYDESQGEFGTYYGFKISSQSK